MFCGEDFKMATSEVEDIAALVGIEIVTDGTCKAVSEEPEQQPPHTPDRPTIAQPGIGECEDLAGTGFSADILTMCSSKRLSALEEEFADRYTKHDEEFAKTLATPTHPPPCVTPWWSNDRGDRSRGRGGQGWGRGRGWGRGHSDRRDYQDRGDYQQRSHGHHDNRYQGRQREDSWDRRDDHRDRGHSWGRRDDHRDRDHRQYRDRSPERRDRH